MPTYRSFIFSFDTLRLKLSQERGWILAVIVCLVLVLSAEVVCRRALSPIGDSWEYWEPEAAHKFSWYRQRASDRNRKMPTVVYAGDSTAARDFVPAAFNESANGVEAFNLGWPENFALASAESTLPLFEEPFDVPELLLVSLSPVAFTGGPVVERLEANIRSAAFCRRYRGELVAGDFIYLARVEAAKEFCRSWFTGPGIGKQPAEGGAQPREGSDPERFNRGPGERPEPILQEDRAAVLRRLANLAKKRGFRVVFVIPPRFAPDDYENNAATLFINRMKAIASDALPVQVLDCLELNGLRKEHFYDIVHLNRSGAEIFSKYLGTLYSGGQI